MGATGWGTTRATTKALGTCGLLRCRTTASRTWRSLTSCGGICKAQFYWPIAEQLEHDAQWLCSQIERNGIPFDVDGAAKLYGELVQIRERMSAELKTLFPPWTVFQGEVTSKANNRKTGHTIGAVYSKVSSTSSTRRAETTSPTG
jgi:hypothetical protein